MKVNYFHDVMSSFSGLARTGTWIDDHYGEILDEQER